MSEPDVPDVQTDLDDAVGEIVAAGVRRIHVLAWRDLDDPDAGGSEAHADEFMRRWAERGIDVVQRTSRAAGLPERASRNGYEVIRRGNRFTVFPDATLAELTRRLGHYDALVEIWNGVPWFSPVWSRRPKITFLHHVHGPMWDQIFPGPLAAAGRLLEARIAPPFYRRGLTVTPSDATRAELIRLGFRPDRVVAVPNGVHPRFAPGGARTPHPSVVAVGRLAPVKRFDVLIRAAAEARRRVPGLTATIAGGGPMRPALESVIDEVGGASWVRLAGHVDHDELVELYRSAWLVASASLAEGWGLSLTEAAACGTPAVATDIAGHHSSVVDGRTGLLVPPERLGSTIADVLIDDARRGQLACAARQRAAQLTWDASALGITRCLVDELARGGRARG